MAALSMASSVTAAVLAAPAAAFSQSSFSTVSSVKVAPVKVNRRLSVVAMATPNKDVKDKIDIADAIAEAEATCKEDPASAPCAVAWDDVEELSAELAHQRDRKKTSSDPLEAYCADNPETDECRTYED
ncbi:hypothetical protein M758_1G122200 [Ceratodon purpureus]|nr:hypothetical protein M758_1G122200 [Ceratodon purpureus]